MPGRMATSNSLPVRSLQFQLNSHFTNHCTVTALKHSSTNLRRMAETHAWRVSGSASALQMPMMGWSISSDGTSSCVNMYARVMEQLYRISRLVDVFHVSNTSCGGVVATNFTSSVSFCAAAARAAVDEIFSFISAAWGWSLSSSCAHAHTHKAAASQRARDSA